MSWTDWQEVQKTRKEHRCDGCYDMIPVGSKAHSGRGTMDGQFWTARLCDPCMEFLDKHSDDFQDGWMEGEIGELRREAEQETKRGQHTA